MIKGSKEEFHKLLQRQVKQHFGEEDLDENMMEFLSKVSSSYTYYDRDHALLERAMDLSSQELIEANQELRKINGELDRFVYSTAHDLRAPLASIIGLLNLIESEPNENISEYISMIRTSSETLDRFIGDIVDYSRNARGELNIKEFDFHDTIIKCFTNLKFIPNAERIDKKLDFQGTNFMTNDQTRLSMILNNLISNAIKYQDLAKEDSFVNIVVNNTNGQCHIKVEDNGIGIREECMPRVFDMFYRASSVSHGSGIGLYIVREVVNRLNGTIEANSVYGQGTTFNITVPSKLG